MFHSSTSSFLSKHNSDGSSTLSSSSDQHKLFLEQMTELNQERQELFGLDDAQNNIKGTDRTSNHNNDNDDYNNHPPFDSMNNNHNQLQSLSPKSKKEEMEDIYQEREQIYNFTKEEKLAWGRITMNPNSKNHPSHFQQRHSPAFMDAIQKAREAKALLDEQIENEKRETLKELIDNGNYINKEDDQQQINAVDANANNHDDKNNNNNNTMNNENNEIFTHLNEKGDEVSMVDISDKNVSKRIAIARSSVLFPQEVMDAFGLKSTCTNDDNNNNNNNDIIGPKGPIFATARLAGIMGAK
jgi:hypothetical protein